MGPREVSGRTVHTWEAEGLCTHGKQKCGCYCEVQSQWVAEVRFWRTLEDSRDREVPRQWDTCNGAMGLGIDTTGNMEE